MVHDDERFKQEALNRVIEYRTNRPLQEAVTSAGQEMTRNQYCYNFFWMGRPIIQGPPDLQAYQEIIWEYKPDLIVETGIARGGSLVFFASMLVLLEHCKQIEQGHVIGIDIDIRPHNRQAILDHPLGDKVRMYQGSSIDADIVARVHAFAEAKQRVLVFLDSDHGHDHVLAELRAYAPLVGVGGYCVVGDTGIENSLVDQTADHPWGEGNSPKSAVFAYLKENKNFQIDKYYDTKALITCAEDGFLKRVKGSE